MRSGIAEALSNDFFQQAVAAVLGKDKLKVLPDGTDSTTRLCFHERNQGRELLIADLWHLTVPLPADEPLQSENFGTKWDMKDFDDPPTAEPAA